MENPFELLRDEEHENRILLSIDVDRLLLTLIIKNNFPTDLSVIEIFFISKLKVLYLRPSLSSLPLLKFLKQNFIFCKICFIMLRLVKLNQNSLNY